MSQSDTNIRALGRGEKDGQMLVEMIEKGEARTPEETEHMFRLLMNLSFNRKVTQEQYAYIDGFRCGVFLAGRQTPKEFAYPYDTEGKPIAAILDQYPPLDSSTTYETLESLIAWAKPQDVWGMMMNNVYSGLFLKREGGSRVINQICRFNWHFKLQRWTIDPWVWSGMGDPDEDSSMIPIEQASARWKERSNWPGCGSR